ncbi:MAG: cytochrome c biogenesis protein CcdA [bacterium]
MRRRLLIILLAYLVGLSVICAASEVKLSTLVSHTSVSAGGDFLLTVNYAVPSGHHLTDNFFGLEFDAQEGFEFGLQQPSAGQFEDGELIRRGQAGISVKVQVGSEVVPGDYTITGKASYQICQESPNFMCFPPVELPFSTGVTIVGSDKASVRNPDAVQEIGGSALGQDSYEATLEDRFKRALVDNMFLAFLLVFAAGFLTSLTPCVYPMIPITISYIGGRSAGQTKFKGFILSLFYVLGLAIVYALLGVSAAVTGGLFGAMTQSAWVIGFVSLIFFVMGLSMLGAFDIQLPSSIQGKLQAGGPKSGLWGAVGMGMVAGLIAAPCAGPIIVALMTYIASTGNILLGFLLMVGFAFGMGLLFIALGTFSGLLASLPAAGSWMDKIKKVFGVVMIAAALYVAKPLMPPPVFGFLIGVGLVFLGAALGALTPVKSEDPIHKILLKAFAILIAVIGIYYVLSLIPIPGKIVPEQIFTSSETPKSAEDSLWRTDFEQALKDAENQKKNSILDFGAEWCKACKDLEHLTFTDPEVVKRLQSLVAVKIDGTNVKDNDVKNLWSRFSVKGLPTIIILDSQGEELGRFTSFLPPKQFIKFLDQTLSSDTIEVE